MRENAYLPNRDQQTIITVANDPRLDGDKKPSRANTEDRMSIPFLASREHRRQRTQRDSDHAAKLYAVAYENRQDKRVARCPEHFSVYKFPAPILLNIVLGRT